MLTGISKVECDCHHGRLKPIRGIIAECNSDNELFIRSPEQLKLPHREL